MIRIGDSMKERPILFSAPMVRAILEGRKSMTRRVVKSQPLDMLIPSRIEENLYISSMGAKYKCPYGIPGDRLWVKETWAKTRVAQAGGEEWFVYRECDNRTDYGGPWKSSRFMPRIASRILLEITNVRVERLQMISYGDSIAEGACRFNEIPVVTMMNEPNRWSMENPMNTDQCLSSPLWAFANYWGKINGPGSWEANPWVWIVEFKRVKP